MCAMSEGVCAMFEGVCAMSEGVCAMFEGVCAMSEDVCAMSEGVCAMSEGVCCCKQGSVCAMSEGVCCCKQASVCAMSEGVCSHQPRIYQLHHAVTDCGNWSTFNTKQLEVHASIYINANNIHCIAFLAFTYDCYAIPTSCALKIKMRVKGESILHPNT